MQTPSLYRGGEGQGRWRKRTVLGYRRQGQGLRLFGTSRRKGWKRKVLSLNRLGLCWFHLVCRGTDGGTVRETGGVNWGGSRARPPPGRGAKTCRDEAEKLAGDAESFG